MAANSEWEEQFKTLETKHGLLEESLSKYNEEYAWKMKEMEGTNEKINTMVKELEKKIKLYKENNIVNQQPELDEVNFLISVQSGTPLQKSGIPLDN